MARQEFNPDWRFSGLKLAGRPQLRADLWAGELDVVWRFSLSIRPEGAKSKSRGLTLISVRLVPWIEANHARQETWTEMIDGHAFAIGDDVETAFLAKLLQGTGDGLEIGAGLFTFLGVERGDERQLLPKHFCRFALGYRQPLLSPAGVELQLCSTRSPCPTVASARNGHGRQYLILIASDGTRSPQVDRVNNSRASRSIDGFRFLTGIGALQSHSSLEVLSSAAIRRNVFQSVLTGANFGDAPLSILSGSNLKTVRSSADTIGSVLLPDTDFTRTAPLFNSKPGIFVKALRAWLGESSAFAFVANKINAQPAISMRTEIFLTFAVLMLELSGGFAVTLQQM